MNCNMIAKATNGKQLQLLHDGPPPDPPPPTVGDLFGIRLDTSSSAGGAGGSGIPRYV